MKHIATVILIGVMFSLSVSAAASQSVASESRAGKCTQPVLLELLPDGKEGIQYRVDGKAYTHYPLTEIATAMNHCHVEHPVYAVIDYRLPAGSISGAVMAKFQANSVRYFVRYPGHLVVEFKMIGTYPKLP